MEPKASGYPYDRQAPLIPVAADPAAARSRWLTRTSICLTWLSLVSGGLWLVAGLVQIFYTAPLGIGDDSVWAGVLNLIQGFWSLAIWRGARSTARRKSLWVAWLTCLAALVPVLSPCFVLGMPIGAVVLALLCRRSVREEFASAQAGAGNSRPAT